MHMIVQSSTRREVVMVRKILWLHSISFKLGEQLFTKADHDRKRGNGFKHFKEERFRSDVRKEVFT